MKMTDKEKLDVIRTYVEAVIEECENAIGEVDNGEDNELDEDELYSYAANEGMNNVALQIMNILNQK